MNLWIEELPLALHLGIVFQFHIGFHPLVTATDEVWQQIVEEQSIHAFSLPLREHCNQHHLDVVCMFPFQCLQQMETNLGSTKFRYKATYCSICFFDNSE